MARTPGVIRHFIDDFVADDVFTLAASLAFYTTLALSPLLVLMLTVLGSLMPATQERVVAELVALGGAQLEPLLRQMIEAADDRPDLRQLAGWGALLVLVFSASVLFAQLQAAMNRIWDAEDVHLAGAWGFVRRRLLSIGLLMTLVFVSIVTLLAQAAISFLPSGEEGVMLVLGSLVALLVYTLLFAALYRFLPDRRIPWATALRGGALTAVLFMLGRAAIGAYLAGSGAAGAFGAAGSVVLWLLWAYYTGIVFLASAELVYAVAHVRSWAWYAPRGESASAGRADRHEVPAAVSASRPR
jgi:membrane protein